MAPPFRVFPPSELPDRVQTILKDGKERRRKDPVDLKKCELKEMVQYNCKPDEVTMRVVCWEYVRLFRRCANGLSVETTAWEGDQKAEQKAAAPEMYPRGITVVRRHLEAEEDCRST